MHLKKCLKTSKEVHNNRRLIRSYQIKLLHLISLIKLERSPFKRCHPKDKISSLSQGFKMKTNLLGWTKDKLLITTKISKLDRLSKIKSRQSSISSSNNRGRRLRICMVRGQVFQLYVMISGNLRVTSHQLHRI